jgi:hypothetical protein
MSSSRGKVAIMPQDMVDRSLLDIDLLTAAPNDMRSSASCLPPKYLLLKIPYRFNTGYQLLACNSVRLLRDWFLALDLQRSRP